MSDNTSGTPAAQASKATLGTPSKSEGSTTTSAAQTRRPDALATAEQLYGGAQLEPVDHGEHVGPLISSPQIRSSWSLVSRSNANACSRQGQFFCASIRPTKRITRLAFSTRTRGSEAISDESMAFSISSLLGAIGPSKKSPRILYRIVSDDLVGAPQHPQELRDWGSAQNRMALRYENTHGMPLSTAASMLGMVTTAELHALRQVQSCVLRV